MYLSSFREVSQYLPRKLKMYTESAVVSASAVAMGAKPSSVPRGWLLALCRTIEHMLSPEPMEWLLTASLDRKWLTQELNVSATTFESTVADWLFRHSDGFHEEQITIEPLKSLTLIKLGSPMLVELPFGEQDSTQVTIEITVPRSAADSVANLLRRWLIDVAKSGALATGFVHVDAIADPYTRTLVEPTRLNRDDFRVEVSGYYWTVLLSESHVNALGANWHETQSIVDDIEYVEGDGGSLLCTLTPLPSEMTAGKLRAWRSALLPVLRPGLRPLEFRELEGSRSFSDAWVRAPTAPEPTTLVDELTVPFFRRELVRETSVSGVRIPIRRELAALDSTDRVDVELEIGERAGAGNDMAMLEGLVDSWLYLAASGRLGGTAGERIHGRRETQDRQAAAEAVCASIHVSEGLTGAAVARLASGVEALEAELQHSLVQSIVVRGANRDE